MTPALQAALSQRQVMIVGLVQAALPGYNLAICDGGWLDWNGQRFVSRDERFGSIQSVEDFADGVGDEAPAGQLTLLPASTSAAVVLSSPDFQGAALSFHFGAVDAMTGKLIDEPDLVFDGELDTTTLNEERGGRTLDMEFVSASERFFADNEGTRLSNAFHVETWPGETGMANVTDVAKRDYWGADKAPTGIGY